MTTASSAPRTSSRAARPLALCARIAVETDLRTQIGQDRADDISAIMGDKQSWFRDEYATCLEAGHPLLHRAEGTL